MEHPHGVEQERARLGARARARLREAPSVSGADGHPRPVLRRGEALLLANDLHLAGLSDEPPSLRWPVEDLTRALSPWHVRVVPDAGP